MRLNYRTLAGFVIATIGIGSINSFAANIGVIAEGTSVFTHQNGQQETLIKGSEVKITLDDNYNKSSSVKVEVNGTYGRVDKKNIAIKQIQTTITAVGTHLRKEPNLKADIIQVIPKDSIVTAYYKHDEWYFVERDGKKGFVFQEFINEDSLYLLERKDIRTVNHLIGKSSSQSAGTKNIAVVQEKVANLITEDAQTLSLRAGDRIKIILDENFHLNERAQVDMNGAYGYIDKRDIQVTEIQTHILEDGAVLRENPDSYAEVIKKLSKDDLVTSYYKYVNWYFVELENGEKGFVYKTQINEENLHLLTRKSNLDKLNALVGRAPAVEVVVWSQAARLLPRGGNATIEDVYTGKKFNIKRTFGSNHADIETLTKADTEIMKQIWGGFTWERRPVIVHVAGRRLAASMAGMPHAGKDSAPSATYTSGRSAGYGYGINLDAVKGNGMDGHVDLHFRESRRHADGRIKATVDTVHQAAINIAAKYR